MKSALRWVSAAWVASSVCVAASSVTFADMVQFVDGKLKLASE